MTSVDLNPELEDHAFASGNSHWGVGEKKLGRTCLSVCVCVCVSKHFGTWRPNGCIDRDGGAGVVPFDAPIRRNDDGAGLGSVGATCHVARGAAQTSARNLLSGLQDKRLATRVSRLQVT